MNLRFRTRLTLSIGCLMLVAVSMMCTALLAAGAALLAAHYFDRGTTLTDLVRNGTEQLLAMDPGFSPPDRIERVHAFMGKILEQRDVSRLAVFGQDHEPIAGVYSPPLLSPTEDEDVLALVERFLAGPRTDEQDGRFGADIGIVSDLDLGQGTRGALFIQFRTSQWFQLMNQGLGAIKWLFVVLVGICILLSIGLSRRVSRPIYELETAVRDFGRGDFSRRASVRSYREIRNLSTAFNAMADDIQRYTRELKTESQHRERLEAELSIGAEVQRALLPLHPPKVAGLQMGGWSSPARQVGGDFYDYFVFSPERVGVAVGDATDKGLPAALLITECSSVLRALTRDLQAPAEVLRRLNTTMCERMGVSGRFVTLALAIFDIPAGKMLLASAGHNPGLLLRSRAVEVERLICRHGLPLGVLPDGGHRDLEWSLLPGDRIFFYSDGITEARSPGGALFGEQALSGLLLQTRALTLDAALAHVRERVEAHMNGADATDDRTLVAIELTVTPPRLPGTGPRAG